MRELLLYGTLGCHLCEVAEQLLLPWVEQGWQVELVDIAEEDALLDRYALLIPVLLHSPSQQQLLWPFDAVTLRQFLQAIQA
ncbi:MAG: glutaredoxin family protein [Pseudomonadales bacterium]|nr:glutaredoxin family protein [Pseudomonadales bacterium]